MFDVANADRLFFGLEVIFEGIESFADYLFVVLTAEHDQTSVYGQKHVRWHERADYGPDADFAGQPSHEVGLLRSGWLQVVEKVGLEVLDK